MTEPVKIGDAELYLGDCRDILPRLSEIDSCVTDPPYGISFMNKKWDYEIPKVEIWESVLETLKPGAHALIACGTRTQHRMAVNIEDAGFEIRDLIAWIYGSGFPKSLNISKALDKRAGIEIETRGHLRFAPEDEIKGAFRTNEERENPSSYRREPVTPEAQQWDGWGTALKPAMELWTLARKPLSESTVADNVLKHGTGGINIDGCRIDFQNESDSRVGTNTRRGDKRGLNSTSKFGGTIPDYPGQMYKSDGRYPANVIHDGSDEVLECFPDGSRQCGSPKKTTHKNGMFGIGTPGQIYKECDESTARFFYCAKASRSERNMGCENIPAKFSPTMNDGIGVKEHNPQTATKKSNYHPTVKPIALMQYLITLVAPPNGTVLDLFMGSGSTGVACARLGRRFIGIENNPEYFEIARQRIDREYAQGKLF